MYTDTHTYTQLRSTAPSVVTALLGVHLCRRYITGGGNENPSPPSALDEDILVSAIVAVSNGVITGTLYQGTGPPCLSLCPSLRPHFCVLSVACRSL